MGYFSQIEERIPLCEYCKNVFTKSQGFGNRQTYCRVECWFQASADEYSRAYKALKAIEHPYTGPDVLAKISGEVLRQYPEIEDYFVTDDHNKVEVGYMCPWCQTTHYDPCELSHEAQAQLNELRDL